MRRPRRTARRDTQFFNTLETTGAPAAAARAAGYPRSNVYRWRASEPAFRARWEEALALYVEGLEHALDRRGFDGTEEPVIYQGKVQYERDEDGELKLDGSGNPIPLMVRKFDTRAAMFRLQHLRPERYAGKVRAGAAEEEGRETHIGDVFDFEAIRTGRIGGKRATDDELTASCGHLNDGGEPEHIDDADGKSRSGDGCD